MYWYCQKKGDVDHTTDKYGKLTKKQDNLEIKRGLHDWAPISIRRETNKIQNKKRRTNKFLKKTENNFKSLKYNYRKRRAKDSTHDLMHVVRRWWKHFEKQN